MKTKICSLALALMMTLSLSSCEWLVGEAIDQVAEAAGVSEAEREALRAMKDTLPKAMACFKHHPKEKCAKLGLLFQYCLADASQKKTHELDASKAKMSQILCEGFNEFTAPEDKTTSAEALKTIKGRLVSAGLEKESKFVDFLLSANPGRVAEKAKQLTGYMKTCQSEKEDKVACQHVQAIYGGGCMLTTDKVELKNACATLDKIMAEGRVPSVDEKGAVTIVEEAAKALFPDDLSLPGEKEVKVGSPDEVVGTEPNDSAKMPEKTFKKKRRVAPQQETTRRRKRTR